MAVLNFYAFDPAGIGADGTFAPGVISIEPTGDLIDTASLDGTALAGGLVNGIAPVDLAGIEYELVKVTRGEKEYYADTNGADLSALGPLKGAADALEDAEVAGDFADASPVAICFARGTLIETGTGPVPVENLVAGDRVITLDHGARPITWVGHSRVRARGRLRPVRIAAGALGENAPSADLVVSPYHRVVVKGWRAEVLFGQEEVLVTASSLVNGETIRLVRDMSMVDYYHILFETHEIIISNGAPSESFNPSSIALKDCEAEMREEIYTLFPELRENPKAFGKAARMVVTGKEARLIADH
ncbi:MAG: Hint domain-containing protein [Pseudomonadota bacterium]